MAVSRWICYGWAAWPPVPTWLRIFTTMVARGGFMVEHLPDATA